MVSSECWKILTISKKREIRASYNSNSNIQPRAREPVELLHLENQTLAFVDSNLGVCVTSSSSPRSNHTQKEVIHIQDFPRQNAAMLELMKSHYTMFLMKRYPHKDA
jgi:hypothetical protein